MSATTGQLLPSLPLTLGALLKAFPQDALNIRKYLFHVVKGQDIITSQLLQGRGDQTQPQTNFSLQCSWLGLKKSRQLLPPQQLLLDSLEQWETFSYSFSPFLQSHRTWCTWGISLCFSLWAQPLVSSPGGFQPTRDSEQETASHPELHPGRKR